MEKTLDIIRERLYETEYWIIDFLPMQVPYQSRGQYFKVEQCYLQHPQIDELYRKFLNIMLKLNCYEDLEVQQGNCEWILNPEPSVLEEEVQLSLETKNVLTILDVISDFMIVINGGDTHITIYNPDENIIKLLKELALSEGLFLWKPEHQV
jgi:hypothetical protein